ncbi:hypothetical protein ACFY04_23145 [Streptomyces sp. NPDC001549]|uniref:hypothetical protein n=1 Tax=Streptomyces sp. NPDC001549 TaxID=3364586 RepID=UPI0036B66012
MRGDETQRGVAPGAESRVVKGPRHAAPRKSLLNKIQIPVGKTMALAAMPTAVFVGMGMAPKLAVADDKEIPFAPGPCVTRSDEPAETESKSPSPTPSTTPSPSTSPSATPSPSASASAKAKPSTSPSAAKPPVTNEVAPAPTPSQDKDADQAKSTNPLDPLGVGDALKNLVDELGRPLKDATAKETPTPAPTPSGTATAAPTPTPDPSADAIREAAKKAGVDVKELSEEVKKTEKDPKNETGEDKAKDDKSKAEDEDKAKDEAKDEATKDPDGKQPFPCPTYDAKALADAELEQGVPLLPDEPWYLDSSLLTLYGLDYHGIVEVKTASGKTKKVLKFTADSLDIKDLYQTVGKSGNVAHLKSRPGSTSKIRGGTVTMYTESLKGNLFGLIPIEFTPNSPPPLNVPFAFFTNVKVVQAGQFGGTLTVPGLKNYIGPPE